MKGNIMKCLPLTVSFALLATSALGVSYVPRNAICPKEEIVWFDVSDEHIVACFGSGDVGCWDLKSGKQVSKFTIKDYKYHRTLVAMSPTKVPTLVVLDRAANWSGGEVAQGDYFNWMHIYTAPGFSKVVSVQVLNMSGVVLHGFTNDGKYIVLSSYLSGSVVFFDVSTGKAIRRMAVCTVNSCRPTEKRHLS
jgi:hypothetical protein